MNHAELVERIQAVLEGVALPEEVQELERRLAADASARAEFEQWQRLFVALDRVPQVSPPEGLVAAITAAAPQYSGSSRDADQLFDRPGVIGHRHPESRGAASWIRATIRRHGRSGPPLERGNMSEQQQRIGSGNRKLWVGGGIAVLALGVALIAFDIPPKSENVTGTIAPAERYRAPQDATETVKLGDQTIAQLMQNDGFDKMVKDPQLQALSKDIGIRALAQVLARSPEAARGMLANIEAAKAASENVTLAQAMLANVDASRVALAAVQAEKQAAPAAQAERQLTLSAQEAAMVAAMAAQAERVPSGGAKETGLAAAQRAELAHQMAASMAAASLIMQSVEASRAALENVAVAQAVAANVDASRILLSKDVGRVPMSSAEASLMVQRAESSRTQLDRAAQAERARQ